MSAGLNLFLVASAALLAVGAFAVVARRSAIITLIGTQFMLMAGAIAFVAVGRFGLGAQNQAAADAMAFFVGAIAVAQLAVGLSLAVVIYRETRSFLLDAERR